MGLVGTTWPTPAHDRDPVVVPLGRHVRFLSAYHYGHPEVIRTGRSAGLVGGDNDLAERTVRELAEGVERLLERIDVLHRDGGIAADVAGGASVEYIGGGVGVNGDHDGGVGGDLLGRRDQGGDEPAAVADGLDDAELPGEMHYDVDAVRRD